MTSESSLAKTQRQLEGELVAEMDRARREYEEAARDYQRVMEVRVSLGIPHPDNCLEIENLGKVLKVR